MSPGSRSEPRIADPEPQPAAVGRGLAEDIAAAVKRILVYCRNDVPITSTLSVSGTMLGRPPAFSGGPSTAVGRYTNPVAGSTAPVRAPAWVTATSATRAGAFLKLITVSVPSPHGT